MSARNPDSGLPNDNHADRLDDGNRAILAQYHLAEYAAFMGRVSSWENLQYAAWPILIAALALLAQVNNIVVNHRWWLALISTLLVYVAYQGTMVNMLFSVLVIERDLRPLAGHLIGTENFWIYERVREKGFPTNPAWSMKWPIVICASAVGAIAAVLDYKYGVCWLDGLCFLVSIVLCIFVFRLTRNAIQVKKEIVKACKPEVNLVR